MVLSVEFISWFQLDDLSHKSSGSSLNANQCPVTPVAGSLENLAGGEFLRRTSTLQSPCSSAGPTQDRPLDEWGQKLYGKQGKGKPLLKVFKVQLYLLELLAVCSFLFIAVIGYELFNVVYIDEIEANKQYTCSHKGICCVYYCMCLIFVQKLCKCAVQEHDVDVSFDSEESCAFFLWAGDRGSIFLQNSACLACHMYHISEHYPPITYCFDNLRSHKCVFFVLRLILRNIFQYMILYMVVEEEEDKMNYYRL
jgi:hypothetical protein